MLAQTHNHLQSCQEMKREFIAKDIARDLDYSRVQLYRYKRQNYTAGSIGAHMNPMRPLIPLVLWPHSRECSVLCNSWERS